MLKNSLFCDCPVQSRSFFFALAGGGGGGGAGGRNFDIYSYCEQV